MIFQVVKYSRKISKQ